MSSSQASSSRPPNPLLHNYSIGPNVPKEDSNLHYSTLNTHSDGFRDGSSVSRLPSVESEGATTTSSLAPSQASRLAPKSNRLKKTGNPVPLNKTGSTSGTARDPSESMHNKAISPPGSPRPSKATPPPKLDTSATSRARPVPLRTQSYSKRHASFDTPREVPMPSLSPAIGLLNTIPTFEDSDREDHSSRDFYTGGTPRMNDGCLSTPRPLLAKAIPPDVQSKQHEPKDGQVGGSQPYNPSVLPHLARNNSAPTPPAGSPGIEQVDILSLRQSNTSTVYPPSRTESSSADSGSGSEYQSPVPFSVTTASSEGTSFGNTREEDSSPEGQAWRHRPNAAYMLHEDRLSTVSLPLPQSHGVESVSRLPPPSKSHGENEPIRKPADGAERSSKTEDPNSFTGVASGLDSPNSVGNLPALTNVSTVRQGSSYRSSFPVTADYGREIPLPGQPCSSSTTRPMSALDGHDQGENRDQKFINASSERPRIEAPNSLLDPLPRPETLMQRLASFGTKSGEALIPGSTEQTVSPNIMPYGQGVGGDRSMIRRDHVSKRGERDTGDITPAGQAHTQETAKHSDTTPSMTVETTSSAYILEASLP
ncbi:hypothetical protein FRC18_004871, partial [Serendipita sp. 400]